MQQVTTTRIAPQNRLARHDVRIWQHPCDYYIGLFQLLTIYSDIVMPAQAITPKGVRSGSVINTGRWHSLQKPENSLFFVLSRPNPQILRKTSNSL